MATVKTALASLVWWYLGGNPDIVVRFYCLQVVNAGSYATICGQKVLQLQPGRFP